MRIDSQGNFLWDKSFGSSAGGSELHSLCSTTDGGFLLGGWSYSGISGDKSSPSYGYQDYWVVKIDSDGNKLWDKSFGGSGYDFLYSLSQTKDGGYILGGQSWSVPSGNKTSPSYGDLGGDYWIIRLNASGDKLWEQSFGGDYTDQLVGVWETKDGGYVLGGGSWSGVSGNKTAPSYDIGGPKGDFWVIKLAPPEPITLSVTGVTDGTITVQVAGPTGLYSVQASTNLVDWETLTSVSINGNGAGSFADPESSTIPSRFYRAVKVE